MTYSIHSNGQTFGPYTLEQVQEYIKQGLIANAITILGRRVESLAGTPVRLG